MCWINTLPLQKLLCEALNRVNKSLKDFQYEDKGFTCHIMQASHFMVKSSGPSRAEVSWAEMYCALSHRTWFNPWVSVSDWLVTLFYWWIVKQPVPLRCSSVLDLSFLNMLFNTWEMERAIFESELWALSCTTQAQRITFAHYVNYTTTFYEV